ncbi:hypothetical protein [Microbacterium gubbeenense]|uniref:hypothetical protein n=1 Tax=Microbacterium gubbeenense TaxID=159896 RepID=UPI0012FACE26|nr:hypothetical protein [Microbacterium gubbeenense]
MPGWRILGRAAGRRRFVSRLWLFKLFRRWVWGVLGSGVCVPGLGAGSCGVLGSGVGLGAGSGVGVGVALGSGSGVAVGVGSGVDVGEGMDVGVGVGLTTGSVMMTGSSQ